MKNKITIALVLTIFIASDSYSQNDDKEYKKIGIGVSLVSLDLINYDAGVTSANRIYVPINISEKFRIEPEFSLSLYDGYYDKFLNVGIGVLKMKRSDNFNFMYGLRVGTTYFISGQTVLPYTAPVLSGEYYLAKQFSLGAEAQLKATFSNSISLFSITMLQIRFYP